MLRRISANTLILFLVHNLCDSSWYLCVCFIIVEDQEKIGEH